MGGAAGRGYAGGRYAATTSAKNISSQMPPQTVDYLMNRLGTDFKASCEQSSTDRPTDGYGKMDPTIGIPLLQYPF